MYIDHKIKNTVLLRSLEKTVFPGSITKDGDLEMSIGYSGGYPKLLEGLSEVTKKNIQERSESSYIEIEKFLENSGIRYYPEFLVPIEDPEVSGKLKKNYLRLDWFLPYGRGVPLECDYDCYHRKSSDSLRDSYLQEHLGLERTIRIRDRSDIPRISIPGAPGHLPVFEKNNLALWIRHYPREIEFLDKYLEVYGRHPLGPDPEYLGKYKVAWSEVKALNGYRTDGPWGSGSNEDQFLRKFEKFYMALYDREIVYVKNQDNTKA